MLGGINEDVLKCEEACTDPNEVISLGGKPEEDDILGHFAYTRLQCAQEALNTLMYAWGACQLEEAA